MKESQKPRVGVGVVVVRDGRLLLGKRIGSHGSSTWACPGGHLEWGEEVFDCARRELLEETGLRAISLRAGPWVNDIMPENKHYVTIYVFVDHFEGSLALLEPHKCEGWHWFEKNALPSPLFQPFKSLMNTLGAEF